MIALQLLFGLAPLFMVMGLLAYISMRVQQNPQIAEFREPWEENK